MGLFDALVNVVEAAVAAPIAITYDAITLGGALTDRDKPMTASVFDKLADAGEKLLKD